MKLLSLAGCALLAVAAKVAAQAHAPPYISDNFEAGVIINAVSWNANPVYQVFGYYAQDATNQRSLLVGNYSSTLMYDTKLYEKKVEVNWIPNSTYCKETLLTETFGPLFQWLPAAQYEGQTSLTGIFTDHWALNVSATPSSFSSLHVYISHTNNVPARLVVADASKLQTIIFDFFEFQSTQPPADWFNVPTTCSSESNSVIGRDDGHEQPHKQHQRRGHNGEHAHHRRLGGAEAVDAATLKQQQALVNDAHDILTRIAKIKA